MRHAPRTLLPVLLAACLWALPLAAADTEPQVSKLVVADSQVAAGGEQIVQVTLRNPGRETMRFGVYMELRNEQDRRVGSPRRQVLRLEPGGKERVFVRFQAPPQPGRYAVMLEVRTADFARNLLTGEPVYYAPFMVGQAAAPPTAREETPAAGPREQTPTYTPPPTLRFERPDLLWENFSLSPYSVLVGEPLQIRADLRNVGGDIARDVGVLVSYFYTRQPDKVHDIADTRVKVLAPGEKVELEFESVLPDESILGEYQVVLVADPADSIDESDEDNNRAVSATPVRLSRIKLIFPEPGYAFEEEGLFLFRWDSRRYDEFKVQVGTTQTFEDEDTYFDIPQGDKWTQDKEVVPLAGELPDMAQGLIERLETDRLYWRVMGRDSETGETWPSRALPFTIKPGPKEPPAQAPAPGQSAPPAPEGGSGGGTPSG